MALLAFSLRESFDGENPWVRRLSGGERRLPRGCAFALAYPAFLAILWTVVLLFELRGMASVILMGSYVLAAVGALLAPALGAVVRSQLDSDECLVDSLLSPLPDRSYLAALHGRILWIVATHLPAYAVTASAIAVALRHPVPKDAFAPPPYVLHMFFKFLGFSDIPSLAGVPVLLVVIACVAVVACYGAGVYLHASMLASVCSLSPTARSRGGALTVLLVVVMPALIWARIAIPWRMAVVDHWGVAAHLGFVAVVETGWTFGRLLLARWVWRGAQRTAMAETRRYLIGE